MWSKNLDERLRGDAAFCQNSLTTCYMQLTVICHPSQQRVDSSDLDPYLIRSSLGPHESAPSPKRHLDRFSRFFCTQQTDKQTHRLRATSLAIVVQCGLKWWTHSEVTFTGHTWQRTIGMWIIEGGETVSKITNTLVVVLVAVVAYIRHW